MGAHMGPYWDYYDTSSKYFSGDFGATCTKSRVASCGADQCGTYCCAAGASGTYGGVRSFVAGAGASCPFSFTATGSTVNGGCTLNCDCSLSNCPVVVVPTTTQGPPPTDTNGATLTTALKTPKPTTTKAATTAPPTQGPPPTDTNGQPLPTTTSPATSAPTTAPATTKPLLPCEQDGTCVTLPPVTQNPNVPTETACPGDCNGNGECVDGECVCFTGLASSIENATVDYAGVDCSIAVIKLPKAICTAFASCELCNQGVDGDGQKCDWHTCGGAGICLVSAVAGTYEGCDAQLQCAGTVVFAPGECPDNCSASGVCSENGTCICKKGVTGINCGSRKGLSAAAKAAAISGGVIAAIVIAGVILIVVISVAAKKTVDWVQLNEHASAKSHVSPLYQDTGNAGQSAMYVSK